ncbi:putative polyketide synthase [Moritella sp. PE36]|uniref:acyl carrier protein n=1 Tax=Moritella sp. PE36 TaxID=58051 RepID=UPI00015699D5|nr:acyl carrier protein [Moritella sp. PE36]EDM66673.1 putative polyketide synthase [Moritella sp. PE36]
MNQNNLLLIECPHGFIILDNDNKLGKLTGMSEEKILNRYYSVQASMKTKIEQNKINTSSFPVLNPTVQGIHTECEGFGLNAAYNIPLLLACQQNTADEQIERFKSLLNSHDILRSTTEMTGNTLYYKVLPVINTLDVKEHTFRTKSQLQEVVHRVITEAFDLSGGPLFSIHRIYDQTNHEEFVLIVLHHMLVDGQGLNQLRQLLIERSTSPVSYQSLEEYQHCIEKNFIYSDEDIHTWCAKFNSLSMVRKLDKWSLEKKRKVNHNLSANKYKQIISYCSKQHCSPFVFFLALSAISYHNNYPEKNTLHILVPTSNRRYLASQSLIGCVTNSVLVPISVAQFSTLPDLIQYLTHVLVPTILSNSHLPLFEVIHRTKIDPDYLFNHVTHEHKYDPLLSNISYNPLSIHSCSFDIQEYPKHIDIQTGSCGENKIHAVHQEFFRLLTDEKYDTITINNTPHIGSLLHDGESITKNTTSTSTSMSYINEQLCSLYAKACIITDLDSISIGEHDDLFLHGINSIRGIKLAKLISQEYSLCYSFRDLLRQRTLSNIATHLEL